MANTYAIKGRAICWSIGNVTLTAGIVSSSTDAFNQSIDVERSSDSAEIRTGFLTSTNNVCGSVATKVWYNHKKTCTLSVVPCAVTGASNTEANARASLDAWMPAPGTLITIADGDVDAQAGGILEKSSFPDAATWTANNWSVVRSRQRRSVDGATTVELELECYEELKPTAAIT